MNSFYNYPHKELWNKDLWEIRQSPILSLTKQIQLENLKNHRIAALPEKKRRKDGLFDPKANALTYPEVVQKWNDVGLHYHCTSMTLPWIAMIPHAHLHHEGYDGNFDTLLVLVNADLSDPSWCMYTLERYYELLKEAALKQFAMLFVASNTLDHENQYISITQEAIILFHLNYKRLYLDVSCLVSQGLSLSDIERSITLSGKKKSVILKTFGALQALPISGLWTNKNSLIHKLITGDASSNLTFDRQALINSGVGRDLAKAMWYEYAFDDATDPSLLQLWNDMGLACEFHKFKGEQWVSFCPLSTNRQKLPCMCILQEVNKFDPHQAITGFSYYFEYLNIAAQGECMLLFFALESLDANDLLHEILEQAQSIFPLDRSRVYITGHSHNGRFAAEYTRRHPFDIAALATLGNEPGQLSPEWTSGFFQVSDKQLTIQASVDIPTINISGYNERNTMFPLHSDAPHVRPGTWVAVDTAEKRIKSWQRRLISSRCPMKSAEEILATKYSSDKVIRILGIPADKTEILFLDGSENYIADIKNTEGNYHLRIVALGNMPHTVTPTMIKLTWSFVRRFAREQETGSCIEL